MSKSLNQIYLPAFGGISLVLAVAVVMSNREYAESELESLQARVAQVNATAETALATAAAEAEKSAALSQALEDAQASAAMMTASLTAPAPQGGGTLGLGRAAHVDEIAAWDVDVLPDGRGLPTGSGDVWTGEEVFADRCGACHGDFAEGVDNWPVLAGGFDTLDDEDPVKTVGSYWPHLSTAWDYISRSMPFGEAGTLTADETYAIVAYILYSNDLVDDDFVLSDENFSDFDMHNANGFVIDDRPELEYTAWRSEPCMSNCKEEVSVTMRSVFLVETPPEGGSNSVMNHAGIEGIPSFTADGPSFIPASAEKPEDQAQVVEDEPAVVQASTDTGDAELIAAGEKVFKKCKACHEIGDGAKNKSGPQLTGILGRTIGSVDGFRYSNAFKALMEEGRVWDEASLAAFLEKPKAYVKGTKMAFAGLKKKGDQEAIVAYLNSFRSE